MNRLDASGFFVGETFELTPETGDEVGALWFGHAWPKVKRFLKESGSPKTYRVLEVIATEEEEP